VRPALALSSFFLVAACAYDGPCGGERPRLSDCSRGLSFAECGGTGDPTLACDDTGRCFWFSDACVARDFVATDCAAGDVCCHASGEGEWPWASWGPSEPGAAGRIADDLAMIGAQPITRSSPAGLSVSVAAPDDSPVSPTVSCTGDPGIALCTATEPLALRAVSEGDTVVIGLSVASTTSPPAQELRIEVVPQYDGRYLARLFTRAPSPSPSDRRSCGEPTASLPAQDGMLTIAPIDPAHPESAHGLLVANVAGGTIDLRF
jgi:hypothetical protein